VPCGTYRLVPGPRALATLLVALGIVLTAAGARAQFPGRVPGTMLFPDLPVRGPVVIYPTLTLGAEYNDNIFLNNAVKRSDFIGSVTPGIQVILESPVYRWAFGYSLTGEKYLDNSELDNAIQRQNFFVTGSHRVTPHLALTLNEFFLQDKSTNQVSLESTTIPSTSTNLAIGRQTSLSNTFNPGIIWEFSPGNSLRSDAAYTLQRYDDPRAASSNTYRWTTDLYHDFTARLTGILGYEARYIDVEREIGVTTHTPRFGARYRFTPTTTGTVIVGPTVRVSSRETGVGPFGEATLASLFSWGGATAYANHYVGVAGGLGGTTENTSVGFLVQVNTWLRDFIFEAGPRYSLSKSTGGGSSVDAHSLSLDLRALYRFTTWLSGVAGYRFFQQRSDSSSSSSLASDVDQNRVFLGVQFGYPIKFD
jgi:hypothetical protein